MALNLLVVPLWAGLMLLPGIAAGEVLGLWGDEPVILRLGTAVGLAIGVSTAFWVASDLMKASSGVTLEGLKALTLLSGGALLIDCAVKRRFDFLKLPSLKTAKSLAFIFGGLLAMLAAYFWANPWFAGEPSVDFTAHILNINSLLSGFTSLSGMLLYYGVYFQLAPLSVLAGGAASTLYVARYGMAVLVLFSFFLVYRCGYDLSERSDVALIASALYVFGAFVWFVDAFNVGIWANFYGLMVSMFALSATVRYFRAERAEAPLFMMVVVALAGLAFGHYSDLLILPALLLLAAVRLASQGTRERAAAYLLLVLAPTGAGAVLFRSSLGAALLGFESGGGSAGTPAPTLLSAAIPLSSLSYVVSILSNDFAALVMLGLVVPYLRVLGRSKEKAVLALPLVWFLSAVAFAPLSPIAWRFSAVALVPLLLMDSIGFFSLIPFERVSARFGKRTHSYMEPTKGGLAVAFCLMWLLLMPLPYVSAGSWGALAMAPVAAASATGPQDEAALVSALQWLGSHRACGSFDYGNFTDLLEHRIPPELRHNETYSYFVPEPCTYVSVSEWRLGLSVELGGPTVYYAGDPSVGVLWSNPDQVVDYAGTVNAQLLIVTRYISEPSVPVINLTLVQAPSASLLQQNITQTEDSINATNSVGTIGVTAAYEQGGTYFAQIARLLVPWTTYDAATMAGYNVVYQDDYVRIYCLYSPACGSWA